MNFTKAYDLVENMETRINEISAARYNLKMALAVMLEIEKGATVSLSLKCKGYKGEEPAEMAIDELLDAEKLTEIVRQKIETTAKENYLFLSTFAGLAPESTQPEEISPDQIAEGKGIPETEDGASVPNSIPNCPNSIPNQPEIETPESIAPKEAQPGIEIPEQLAQRKKINDKLIEELYYKQGKTVKEIVEQTGYGESTIFKHISDMKAAKTKAAKECARR